ncbi:MAG: PucR family transcriptional regulator [Aeromicrobium sp.]
MSAPTLRVMLDMPALAAGRPEIVVGGPGLDRPVRWVHVAEVPVMRDLLDGHEVVLTTGLPFTADDADPSGFVRQLVEAEARGLVVELGSQLPSVPQEVVGEARRLDLPLIALHAPIKFIEVTEAVHRVIVGEQYRGLAFAQETHEVFTELSLDSADSATIVTRAAMLIDEPVVLEDAGRRVVAMASHDSAPREVLARWEERSRAAPVLERPGTTGPEHWLTCPVGLRGSAWGRLVAPDAAADPVETAVVLQRAAQALQLSRLVQRDVAGLQFQARESLLLDLMESRVTDEVDAIARARALGMSPQTSYLPVVAHFGATAATDQIVRKRRARAQLEAISEAARAARIDVIAGGVADGQVGLVIALRAAAAEDAVLDALSKALIFRQGTREPATLGVGPSSSSLVGATAQLRTTMHIASAGHLLPGAARPWYRSTDVRLRGLVAQLQDDDRVVAFTESELGPLLAHDSTSRDELLTVLRSFVRLGGNKAAVAEDSHLSRQALYGRLRRIESILGVDLDDAESAMSLGLAILVNDLRAGVR